MTDVRALIVDMVKAGVDPELIGRTAEALAQREAVLLPDEAADRRRAKDRERKRLRKSAESTESAEIPEATLSPKESPQTPKETTPILPSTPKETPLRGSKKAVRLPSDWELPLDWEGEAEAMGLPRNRIAIEAQTMRDWSLSSPDGAKRDWHAAWRNWVRRAVERLPRGSPQYRKPEPADHFKDLSKELIDEHDRESRGNGHDWHDAEGLPLIAIQHHG